jgi:hypothetical protein
VKVESTQHPPSQQRAEAKIKEAAKKRRKRLSDQEAPTLSAWIGIQMQK